MRLSGLFRIRKSRKYTIKRDKEGLSLRARCFGLFEQGKRPIVVVEGLKMKETVCRSCSYRGTALIVSKSARP